MDKLFWLAFLGMPVEEQIEYMHKKLQKTPGIINDPPFKEWATKNSKLIHAYAYRRWISGKENSKEAQTVS